MSTADIVDHPFSVRTVTPGSIESMADYASIPASQQAQIDPNMYNFFQAVSYKINGGIRGMIDLIVYAGCVGGFISLQVSTNSIYTDIGVITSGLNVPFDSNITDYNKMISYIVMIGVVLSLIRIVFADKFVKEVKINRIFELIFGIVIWSLFLAALIITYIIRGQLIDAVARSANITDLSKAKALSLAQKQVDTQLVILGLAVTGTTFLTAYNIYDLFKSEELKIGAGLVG